MSDATRYYTTAETRLAYPGERLSLITCGATREAPSLEAAKLSAPRVGSVDVTETQKTLLGTFAKRPYTLVTRELASDVELNPNPAPKVHMFMHLQVSICGKFPPARTSDLPR